MSTAPIPYPHESLSLPNNKSKRVSPHILVSRLLSQPVEMEASAGDMKSSYGVIELAITDGRTRE
jgi:hypothetical protein